MLQNWRRRGGGCQDSERFFDEESSATTEIVGRTRFRYRGWETEKRVARGGDICKMRRGGIRFNPGFSETDKVRVAGINYVEEMS